jgi:NADP-dependent 3-hydroxy acid dehydrogenase YdfG
MRDETQIVRLIVAARAAFGGVDLLVNNAGLGRKAPVSQSDSAPWREMLDVNVLGLLIATREAIRDMERRQVAGQVINVSSMAGHRIPGPDSAVYAGTKFAVRAITEGLRQELRARQSPIRVAAVSPGYVDTEFADVFSQTPGASAQMSSRIRQLDARDVAEAIVWIATRPPHVEVHDVLVRPTAQKN